MLKPDGQAILMMALISLEDAERSLKDGSIEFQMVMLIHDHYEQFLMLCKQISVEESEQPPLEQLLDQRCAELTAFQEEREKVSSFIRMCFLIKQGKENWHFVLCLASPSTISVYFISVSQCAKYLVQVKCKLFQDK